MMSARPFLGFPPYQPLAPFTPQGPPFFLCPADELQKARKTPPKSMICPIQGRRTKSQQSFFLFLEPHGTGLDGAIFARMCKSLKAEERNAGSRNRCAPMPAIVSRRIGASLAPIRTFPARWGRDLSALVCSVFILFKASGGYKPQNRIDHGEDFTWRNRRPPMEALTPPPTLGSHETRWQRPIIRCFREETGCSRPVLFVLHNCQFPCLSFLTRPGVRRSHFPGRTLIFLSRRFFLAERPAGAIPADASSRSTSCSHLITSGLAGTPPANISPIIGCGEGRALAPSAILDEHPRRPMGAHLSKLFPISCPFDA